MDARAQLDTVLLLQTKRCLLPSCWICSNLTFFFLHESYDKTLLMIQEGGTEVMLIRLREGTIIELNM